MKNNAAYPHLKVIIFFTLCSAFGGLFFGFLLGWRGLLNDGSWKDEGIWIIFFATTLFPLVCAFVGGVLFALPAFLAALLYAGLRLYKVWYNFIFVGCIGGSAAHLWTISVLLARPTGGYTLNYIFSFSGSEDFGFSMLAVVSSVVVAFFILPKKPPKHKNNNNE